VAGRERLRHSLDRRLLDRGARRRTYAAGKLDVFTDWIFAFDKMRVIRLLDPTFRHAGLFKGERIIGELRELVGDHAIEDLPLPFTAVATDLATGSEVWLRQGKLFDAIRASIATPMIFTPFEDGERKLLDGGLVDPVPVEPTLDDPTDLTVAIDVFGVGDPPSSVDRVAVPHGIVDIALAAMEAMQTTIARLRLKVCAPDVLVEIPRRVCGYHEFWRAKELIALGREQTAQAFADLGR
jgi:NTE family protein